MKRHHQTGKRKGRLTFLTPVSFRQKQEEALIEQKLRSKTNK